MIKGRLSWNRQGVIPVLAALAILWGCGTTFAPPPEPSVWPPPPEAMTTPNNLPSVGKWMFDAWHQPAHWLGELFKGKRLREPINIILVDAAARSAEEAKARLVQYCERAGYPVREGHSAGYLGIIDGVAHPQLPEGKRGAFADGPFEVGNNHGRFFGPHPFGGAWIFIGAFSREKVDPVSRMKHRYASFNQARDDLAQRLDERTDFKISDYVDLDNALIDDDTHTTGDHDGIAVLLTVQRP